METNNPTCSHCGYEFNDEETWYYDDKIGDVNTGDCEHSELTCPNNDCGKKFYVNCIHLIKFIQTDEDGDEI